MIKINNKKNYNKSTKITYFKYMITKIKQKNEQKIQLLKINLYL